ARAVLSAIGTETSRRRPPAPERAVSASHLPERRESFMSMRYRSACLAAAVLTLAVGLGKPVYADKPADLPVDPRVTCTPGAATRSDGVRYITLREAVLSALMRSQAPACGEEEAEAEEIPENPVAVNQCDDTGGLMFGVGVNSDAGLVGDIVLNERNFDIS